MSIKIVGATSGTEMEVDTTPAAGRVIIYDSQGNPIQRTIEYAGIVLVNVRQSAATGAGVATWGLYNNSATKILRIKSIYFSMFFDGTAAATLMKYEWLKMTGITTFSGGAVVTPSHKITSLSGAYIGQARVLDTGLTTTGGTAQAAMWNGAKGRVTQTTTNFEADTYSIPVASQGGQLVSTNVQLAQNEALILRQLVTSVIGDNVVGSVEFDQIAA
jgi:hypothetical protein